MPLADGGCEHRHCQHETIQDRRRGERRSGMDRRTGLRYEPDHSDRRASRRAAAHILAGAASHLIP